jgi:uncharacterized protein (DUF433 family)
MSYRDIITIEPDKRGGKPCIRRMRITVYDVLGWLAAGMSVEEIIDDFPELTEMDIRACLERSRLFGSPPKVVWLRCGNTPTNQVESLLRSGQDAIRELLNNPVIHCLELH